MHVAAGLSGKSSEKMPTPAKALNRERTPEVTAAIAHEKRKRNRERKAELATELNGAARLEPTNRGLW